MKTCFEYLIVAVIAVLMALAGYWLMDVYAAAEARGLRILELDDVGWTVWSCSISVITWVYLYRHCRRLHWLVLPAMGLISPFVGAVLFFIPFLWMPWVVLWQYTVVVPVAFVSLLVYPLCLALAIAFIRLELSLKWLLLPAILITADTALLSVGVTFHAFFLVA